MTKKFVFLSMFLLFSGTVFFGQSFLHSQPLVPQAVSNNSQQASSTDQVPAPTAAPETKTPAQPEPTQTPSQPEPAKAPEAQPTAESAPTPATPAPTPSAPPEQPRTPKYQVFKIGDSFKANTLTFTLKNIYFPSGNGGNKPEAGKVYLALDLSIENTGDAAVGVNSYMLFRLKDDNGNVYTPESNGELAGKIGPGREITGQALFQVPAELKYFALEIDPSVVGAPITNLEIAVPK